MHYSAQTFASAYIQNNGNSDFTIKNLPNQAQISSINDFIIEDVNNDGHKDLITVGNLFPAEIETTRNDAGIGLLMLGDGKGNWQPQTANQSGISIPHDVKKAITIDTKKGKLYLFGVNNGQVQVFGR